MPINNFLLYRIAQVNDEVALTLNFTVTSDTPAFNLTINVTFPNFITVLNSSANGIEMIPTPELLSDVTFILLNTSQLSNSSTLKLEIYFKIINASVGILLQPESSMKYLSLPNDGEIYNEEVEIPSIFIAAIEINASLIHTSEQGTENATITYHEFAIIEIVIGIVGPIIELTLNITTEEDALNVINGQESHVG